MVTVNTKMAHNLETLTMHLAMFLILFLQSNHITCTTSAHIMTLLLSLEMVFPWCQNGNHITTSKDGHNKLTFGDNQFLNNVILGSENVFE